MDIAPASVEQVGEILHVNTEADAFATLELVGSFILAVDGVSPRSNGATTFGIHAAVSAQIFVVLDKLFKSCTVLLGGLDDIAISIRNIIKRHCLKFAFSGDVHQAVCTLVAVDTILIGAALNVLGVAVS